VFPEFPQTKRAVVQKIVTTGKIDAVYESNFAVLCQQLRLVPQKLAPSPCPFRSFPSERFYSKLAFEQERMPHHVT
jgi:hypothetical protein